jgi:Zn-dependent peptidase ImmA (M78 family)
MVDWKHRKAEREVSALLDEVARQNPALLEVFPRALEDLLASAFPVSFESCSGLKVSQIVEILQRRYQVDDDDLLVDGDVPLAGYTFARGDFAVIFSDSGLGEEYERFTKAHEVGHLVIEYWPQLARSKQPTLFGGEPGPALYARRDPPGNIFVSEASPGLDESAMDHYRRLKADHRAWLREIKANGFAAELLAPYREVQKLVSNIAPGQGRLEALRARFGISRRAAEIRLTELGLLTSSNPARSLFP